MKFVRAVLLAGAIALELGTTTGASAATCGSSSNNNSVLFTVSNVTDPCVGFSNGPVFGIPGTLTIGANTYLHLDTTGSNTNGFANGVLSTSASSSSSSNLATWSVSSLSGFTNLILVFQHTGRENQNPDWAAFAMNGSFLGNWLIQNGPSAFLELRDVSLYGQRAVLAETPVPAAFFLFGTVLAGVGGWRRWFRPPATA